jgi:hypothetical protein
MKLEDPREELYLQKALYPQGLQHWIYHGIVWEDFSLIFKCFITEDFKKSSE